MSSMKTARPLLALVACLAGCTVGPNFQSPDVAVPENFAAGTQSAGNGAGIDLQQWWRSFHDSNLNALEDQALQSNLDLDIALARVEQAQTVIAATRSALLPTIDGTAGGGKGSGNDETNGRVLNALRAAENPRGLQTRNAAGGFALTWQPDLYGRVRRLIEAHAADTQALIEARNWVQVMVTANVARAYLDLRANQRELAVLNENIQTAKKALNLAQARFAGGLTNEIDVSLAQRQLATLQSDQPVLASQIDASRNTLATLTGQFPQDINKALVKSGPLPNLPTRIPVGLPIDLLRRRPDIREIEWQAASANAYIGVAIADLFPTVTLTGSEGWQNGSQTVGSKVVPFTSIGSYGLGVSAPLLDFGALDAKIQNADFKTHELLLVYRLSILRAVQQVDDSSGAYRAQRERLKSLDRALIAARKATEIAIERYDRGLTDFLNVLDAEREEFALEQRAVEARRIAGLALVSLFEALGGGWPLVNDIPPIRPADPALLAAAKYAVSVH